MEKLRIGRLARRTVVASAVGLVAASSAGAVAIYSQPGSAGGPPTPANGSRGTAYTSEGVTVLGNALAGYTALQLVEIQTVTLTVHFPAAGTIYGRIGATGVGELGEGFAGRANRGVKPMSLSLSAKGRAYLFSRGNLPTKINLKFAFQPNTGKTEYSTATLTTAP